VLVPIRCRHQETKLSRLKARIDIGWINVSGINLPLEVFALTRRPTIPLIRPRRASGT